MSAIVKESRTARAGRAVALLLGAALLAPAGVAPDAAAAGAAIAPVPGSAGAPAAPGPDGTGPVVDAAGPVRLEVAIDRSAITVGDPLTVTLRLSYPHGTRVTRFDPEGAFGPRDLLDSRHTPAVATEGNRMVEVRTLRVTSYKPGAQQIPAFEAVTVDAGGREGKTGSAPVPFEVKSVLTTADAAPADIKSPAFMPGRVLWPWLLATAAAAALLAWAWWRRRRRRGEAPAPAVPAVPPRPPHEIAYAELERLLSGGLLESGRIKEFYIELAEIVKRYLTARFGVETFERTSWEILEALRVARLPIKVSTALSEFFSACDLVKFARYVPEAGETRAAVDRAYRLVDETRPVETAPPEPALAVEGAAR